MKKKLHNFVRLAKAKTILIIGALFTPALVYSQGTGKTGKDLLTDMNTQVTGLGENLVTLLRNVMWVVAGILAAMTIANIIKGERESAQKLAWWVAGVVVGSVIFTFIANNLKG